MNTDIPTTLNLATEADSTSKPVSDHEALDHIRSILFGEQISRLGQRIDEVELLLAQQVEQLRELVESRFETLAEDIREVDRGTASRIETEQAILQSGIDSVSQQLLQTTDQVGGELELARTEMAQTIEKVVADFAAQQQEAERHSQSKNQELANLFFELGNRLNTSASQGNPD